MRALNSDFVGAHLSLSWVEVFWGYDRGMIGWSGPVDMAIAKIQAGSEDALELDLASVFKSETFLVRDLLEKLVERSRHEGLVGLSRDQDLESVEASPDLAVAKRKWLYLRLLWLYENRTKFEAPFAEVDMLYAVFDYPESMAPLVSYLPANPGSRGRRRPQETYQSYHERIWRQFLDSEREELSS